MRSLSFRGANVKSIQIITLSFKFHRQSLTMSGRVSLIYLKGQNMTGIRTVGYKTVFRHSFAQDPSSPVYLFDLRR